MAKPRVHEIAAELGIDSKTALEKLKEMGEFVKGSSSSVEPPVARKLKAALAADGITAPKPAEEPKKAPAKQDAARQEKNQEQQAKELMEQIEGLEAKLAAMQADFGPDTPWQAYQEYKVLEQERDELYEQWEALQ